MDTCDTARTCYAEIWWLLYDSFSIVHCCAFWHSVYYFFSSCAFSHSEDRFWQESWSSLSLPQVRLVPGEMFLCGGATSLSYLPVISVGRQGTTPSLAPEPQASPGHQPAAPHSMYSLRAWLFWVCHSLLVPKCVKKKKQSWVKQYLQNVF